MLIVDIKNQEISIPDIALVSTEEINELQEMITLELKRRGEIASDIAIDLPAYAIASGLVKRTTYSEGYVGTGIIAWVGVQYTVAADGENITYTLVP